MKLFEFDEGISVDKDNPEDTISLDNINLEAAGYLIWQRKHIVMYQSGGWRRESCDKCLQEYLLCLHLIFVTIIPISVLFCLNKQIYNKLSETFANIRR